MTSPPAVIGDLAVVGSSIADNQRTRPGERRGPRVRRAHRRAALARGARGPRSQRREASADGYALGRQRVVVVRGRRGARPRLRAHRQPDPRLLAAAIATATDEYANSVVAMRGTHGRARLELPDGAPRPVGLRRAGAAAARDRARATARRSPSSSSRRRWACSSCCDRETGEPLFRSRSGRRRQATLPGTPRGPRSLRRRSCRC